MIKLYFQKIILIATLTIILSGCLKHPPTIEDQYPAPWRKPVTTDLALIAPILFKSGIGGCTHFYLRDSKNSGTEFLIACTDDFVNWTYYTAQTKTEEVLLISNEITPPAIGNK